MSERIITIKLTKRGGHDDMMLEARDGVSTKDLILLVCRLVYAIAKRNGKSTDAILLHLLPGCRILESEQGAGLIMMEVDPGAVAEIWKKEKQA